MGRRSPRSPRRIRPFRPPRNIREEVEREVAEQFQKKFRFRPLTDGKNVDTVPMLPPLDTVFRTQPPYQVESLQTVKAALNKVKNRLNDFEISDWHQHTRRRSSLQPVLAKLKNQVGAEFVTQAFAKLYECVSAYELVPPASESREFYSVHLCEAPGAFITGLNHYLKLNRERVQWRLLRRKLPGEHDCGRPVHPAYSWVLVLRRGLHRRCHAEEEHGGDCSAQ